LFLGNEQIVRPWVINISHTQGEGRTNNLFAPRGRNKHCYTGGEHTFLHREGRLNILRQLRGGEGHTYFYVVKGDCAVNVVEDDVREKSIIASKLFEEAKVLRDLEGIFDRFLFEPFANKNVHQPR